MIGTHTLVKTAVFPLVPKNWYFSNMFRIKNMTCSIRCQVFEYLGYHKRTRPHHFKTLQHAAGTVAGYFDGQAEEGNHQR